MSALGRLIPDAAALVRWVRRQKNLPPEVAVLADRIDDVLRTPECVVEVSDGAEHGPGFYLEID